MHFAQVRVFEEPVVVEPVIRVPDVEEPADNKAARDVSADADAEAAR